VDGARFSFAHGTSLSFHLLRHYAVHSFFTSTFAMQTQQIQAARRGLQIVLAGVTIITLVWAMFYSGRVAFSTIFMKYGTAVLDTTAVDTAMGLTPNDAEVHYARGALFNYFREPDAALKELELAVSLRPRDYYFWQELGMTREQVADQSGALFCFNEAVRLAPYYAQPRWQRGNFLFRRGSYDEAFADLRQAATSNPDFLPALIDLAWGASGKDAELTDQIVQLPGGKEQYALALFFARHGKANEAVAHLRSASGISTEDRRNLIKELLAAGSITQAFEVWSGNSADSPPARGTVFDGGFEGSLNLDETGFGWHLAPAQPGLSMSLDGRQPQSGSRSLRIDFSGHANPAAELFSQLIPAEPIVRYKLNFAARTNDIVTGGPLQLVIKDSNGQQVLGRSAPLPAKTGGWQTFSVEFATGAASQAIVISLQREACTSSPCPIFGVVNLDGFSLERLK
jgi:tetratricopeptide (TPR) repeat protein